MRLLLAAALVITGLAVPGATAANHGENALLPDLAMLQPDDFRVERKPGGVRWLRFATTIVNVGAGRFDVYGSNPDPSDTTKLTKVTQRIQDGSGGWVEHDTLATMFYAGDGHNHWHVYGLQDWRLAFEATPNDAVATGAKTGFCFWDNVDLWNLSSYYNSTNSCHMRNGTVPMGLSVGWGDRYPATIAFQYIDISHLPYGNYCLTLIADPSREFIESDIENNTTRTLISIRKNGAAALAESCGGETSDPPSGGSVHIADLDGSVKVKGQSGRWEASVRGLVLDQLGNAVGGATVVGEWSGAASGTSSGTTGSDGWVTVSSGDVVDGTEVTFTVSSVLAEGMTYDSSLNDDPEPDSDGTVIIITRP